MKNVHTNYCPIAGMLNIVGDRWVWLIIREAFYGATRFSEFERNIGLAKNLLSDRLSFLVEEGILEKTNVSDVGTRFAYSLTDKGASLGTVMIAMFQWGNAHLYQTGESPIIIRERATGKPVKKITVEAHDGSELQMTDLEILPTSFASKATRERLAMISANSSQTHPRNRKPK